MEVFLWSHNMGFTMAAVRNSHRDFYVWPHYGSAVLMFPSTSLCFPTLFMFDATFLTSKACLSCNAAYGLRELSPEPVACAMEQVFLFSGKVVVWSASKSHRREEVRAKSDGYRLCSFFGEDLRQTVSETPPAPFGWVVGWDGAGWFLRPLT